MADANMGKVVLLYGPCAVGKYTVAKQLAAIPGYSLLDNHLFHDVIVPFIAKSPDRATAIFDAAAKIREAVLEVVEKFPLAGQTYIFTNFLIDTLEDAAYADRLETFAKRIGARFFPIELHAPFEILARRLGSEDRRMRQKLTNPDILKQYLLNPGLFHYKHANAQTIDVADLSPQETAARIIAHLTSV